jgi:hypothetical protein
MQPGNYQQLFEATAFYRPAKGHRVKTHNNGVRDAEDRCEQGVVYQFKNTIQVKKTPNCVSVFMPWRGLWQKT